MVGKKGEATRPHFDRFVGEDSGNAVGERMTSGGVETHKEQARVGAGLETPHVGKIEILSDEKSPFVLGGLPDIFLRVA